MHSERLKPTASEVVVLSELNEDAQAYAANIIGRKLKKASDIIQSLRRMLTWLIETR